MPLPREFMLVAACCRWPLDEDARAGVRAQAADAINWAYVMRIVQRQRVAGLVHNALLAAKVVLPPPIAQALAAQAEQIARRNLALAAETARLQRAFAAAGIPVIVLKGVALAQLAYGSLTVKHGKDIDFLVRREQAHDALQLLERDGYALRQPARRLSDRQREAALQYGLEFLLAKQPRKLQVELRWRLTANPLLLSGIESWPQSQNVRLTEAMTVRTLADELLFAYLCVHGAGHAWSRLKWLADLNALIAQKPEADIERLFRYAEAAGSGICAGQALLLCRRLLQAKLPAKLADELESSRRLNILAAMAMAVMTAGNCETEIEERSFGPLRVDLMQSLLGRGWRYHAAQCRVFSVRLGDAIMFPLPSSLYFLYPVLRLPLMIWRRANRLVTAKLTGGAAKADSAARD